MTRWYKTPRIWKWLAMLQIWILLVIWSPLFFSWFEPPVTPPVTLSLLVLESEIPYWKPLTQEFHDKHPKINIKLTGAETTDGIKEIYTTDFQQDSPNYDLVYMDIIWLPKFAKEERLRQLDDDRIAQAVLKQDFLEQEVKLGQYEGHLYRIPFRSDAGVLFYRKDLLEKAGVQPPTTFPEVLQASQKLKELKLKPLQYLWQGKQYEGLVATYFEVLSGHNGFWINSNTKEVGLDKDEAIEAAEFLHSAIAKEISPEFITTYDEDDAFGQFVRGEAAFMRGWPDTWDRSEANNSKVKGNVGFISIVDNKEEKIVACLGGWGFGIAAKTQHPEQAWLAIKFFTSEEVQRKFVMKSSYLPTRTKLFSDADIVAKYPQFKDGKMLQIVNEAVPRPIIPEYDEASKILQRYLSKALSNELTPEAAMRLAARETRALLEKVEK